MRTSFQQAWVSSAASTYGWFTTPAVGPASTPRHLLRQPVRGATKRRRTGSLTRFDAFTETLPWLRSLWRIGVVVISAALSTQVGLALAQAGLSRIVAGTRVTSTHPATAPTLQRQHRLAPLWPASSAAAITRASFGCLTTLPPLFGPCPRLAAPCQPSLAHNAGLGWTRWGAAGVVWACRTPASLPTPHVLAAWLEAQLHAASLSRRTGAAARLRASELLTQPHHPTLGVGRAVAPSPRLAWLRHRRRVRVAPHAGAATLHPAVVAKSGPTLGLRTHGRGAIAGYHLQPTAAVPANYGRLWR